MNPIYIYLEDDPIHPLLTAIENMPTPKDYLDSELISELCSNPSCRKVKPNVSKPYCSLKCKKIMRNK